MNATVTFIYLVTHDGQTESYDVMREFITAKLSGGEEALTILEDCLLKKCDINYLNQYLHGPHNKIISGAKLWILRGDDKYVVKVNGIDEGSPGCCLHIKDWSIAIKKKATVKNSLVNIHRN